MDDEGCCAIELSELNPKPNFGDLLQLCGHASPRFPPSGAYRFDALSDLQLEQIDDYFGVRLLDTRDVVIWLYPLASGAVADHHPGPFDGLRIVYDCEHHTPDRARHFLNVAISLAGQAKACAMKWRDSGVAISRTARAEQLLASVERCCAAGANKAP